MNDAKSLLDRFAKDFASVVEKHCKYIIVSGFVAIAHGRSRGTEDIDMIIERVGKKSFALLHEDIVRNGFACLQGNDAEAVYEQYLKNDLSVRYVRNGQFLPEMELKLAKDALDRVQLATRKKLAKTALDLWFSSIEMNIAFKEELLKSDKDLKDARHLRIIYDEEISGEEITRIKKMIRRLRL